MALESRSCQGLPKGSWPIRNRFCALNDSCGSFGDSTQILSYYCTYFLQNCNIDLKQGSNLKLFFPRTRTKTKPHIPCSEKWGLPFVLSRAFVSHASSITERFPDQKAIHPPGPKTVKHLTQMSRKRQEKQRSEIRGQRSEPQSLRCWSLDSGY